MTERKTLHKLYYIDAFMKEQQIRLDK